MQSPYELSSVQILKIKSETKDTRTFTLKYSEEMSKRHPSFQPGQFIMVSIYGFGEAPFSLSSIGCDRVFEITIRNVGNLTNRLFNFHEGEKIDIRGPYGRGWPIHEVEGKDILIIAGGIGLSPLKPVITHISENRDRYGKLEILYGAKTPDYMVHVEDFKDWRNLKDARLSLTVDSVPRGVIWDYKIGVVPILFNDMETSSNNSIVFTCGPEIMMHFVIRDLLSRGFGEDQLFVSLERRMKCGIAQCGHCQLGAKYVCKDGPVFPYSELIGLPDLLL